MTEQTEEITKLTKWCQKARAIIGKGHAGDARKMEKQINKVSKMLTDLSRQTGDTDKLLFEAGMESFRAASAEHEKLRLAYVDAKTIFDRAKETEKGTKKGSKERSEAGLKVAEAEQKMIDAREKIRDLMGDMETLKDVMKSDAPLAKEVHFFEISVRNAENQISNLLTQEHADAVQLNGALRILATWKNEVATNSKYKAPAEVRKLTLQIKPLLTSLARDLSKDSSGKRKLDETQSRARGGAEEKLREAKALLQELTESGKLVPSIGTQLRSAIKQAGELYAQEKWIQGAELLKPLPSRQQCLEAFERASTEAGVDFAAELEQSRLVLTALKQQSDNATWQRFDRDTKLLQGRAGAPSRKPRDNAELLKDFRAHLGQMKAEVKFGVEASKRLTTLLSELENSARTLEPVAPLNRVEENRRQIQLIKLLQDERRWKEAEDTARLLETSMKSQANPDFEKWRRAGPDLRGRGMLNDLRMAVGNPGATPALKSAAERLLKRIAEPSLAILEGARSWTLLMALHAEAKQFVLGLAGEIQKFKDFADGRSDADGAVQPRFERCASALSELERALTQAGGDPAPVLKPMQARLQELKSEWKQCLASATEAADLNQSQMEQDLNLLMQWILSANYGKNLTETVDGQREAAGKAEFDKAVTSLESTSLGPLEKLSVSMAAEFRGEIATLSQDSARETDPTKPWAERLLGLQAIASRVTTGISEAETACTNLNRELTGKAEAVALVLQGTREELRSKGVWASLERRYEPMFEFLEEELAGLRELLTTTNTTAAEGNRKLLDGLKKRADELIKLATHSEGLDGREERVENVGKRLEALRKDGLSRLAAETNGTLGQQLKDLRRDMFGMEPAVLNQALDELDTALLEARKELDGVLQQQLRIKELEKDLRPRVARLKQSGVAGDYYDKLLERIGAAAEQSLRAGQQADAMTAMTGVATEVARAENDPKAALAQQKLQNTEAHALRRLKLEYEGRLKTVKSAVVPRAARAVEEAGGDAGQIDEVKRMVTLAEKAAKGGDYERAIQTLQRTENRVVEIENNPAGTALGDRNALPKHLETFAGQVNKLRDELGAFVGTAVEKVPEDSREAVRKLLADAVLKVKAQLNPRVFDLYAGDITDTGKPVADRRAVRDQALQRVRELRVFITAQPMVVKLANNPILPLLGPLRLVDSSLTRIEAHLRAAIR